MSRTEARLKELGLELPPVAAAPNAEVVPAVVTGNLIFLSGVLPRQDGKLVCQGRVNSEVSIADGARGARIAALMLLSRIKDVIGDLDRVVRVVKVTGYVNADPGLPIASQVVAGASQLFVEVFGPERGTHARTSLGVSALAGNGSVEIEAVVEFR